MSVATGTPHRGTIFVEDARILSQESFAGQQFMLRLAAPQCAARATAGSFVHVAVDPSIPMRRPLSIMRVDREAGWIELLYKIHGHGLQHLAARRTRRDGEPARTHRPGLHAACRNGRARC